MPSEIHLPRLRGGAGPWGTLQVSELFNMAAPHARPRNVRGRHMKKDVTELPADVQGQIRTLEAPARGPGRHNLDSPE